MDIASTLIGYLNQATALEWFHDSPVNAPAEYGTLSRDGGSTELVRDLPTMTFIVYASTRGRAANFASSVKRALIASKWELDNVFDATIESDYCDPLDGKHRHRITATLITND